MSLDNIRLPGFIIQDLFHKSLVDINSIKNESLSVITKELNFFGGNKQHIILLVKHPDIAFITDQQLTFLSGILNACKLTLEDIGLLNIASSPAISYKSISDIFNPRTVIMFGISPHEIQLPFIMPAFQRQLYNNQVYLAVPSLTDIENDRELKSKLWSVLQQVFSL